MPLHQRVQHGIRSSGQRVCAGSGVFVQKGPHVVEGIEIAFGIQEPDDKPRLFGAGPALSEDAAGRPGDIGKEGRHGLFRSHQIIAAVFRGPQHHVRGLQECFRALIMEGGKIGNVRAGQQGVRVSAGERGGEGVIHALSEILTRLVAQVDARPCRQR